MHSLFSTYRLKMFILQQIPAMMTDRYGQWRRSIPTVNNKKIFTLCARWASVIIFYSLLQSGIEPNPGPHTNDTREINEHLNNHRKNLKLLLLNIQSLTKKHSNLKEDLKGAENTVIILTETWLNKKIHSNSLNLPNHTLIRQDRNTKRGGGLAMYIPNHFKMQEIKNVKSNCIESLWCEINNSIIGAIYRPPNQRYKTFLKYFDSELEHIMNENKKVTILGDFNIDLGKPANPENKEYQRLITKYNLEILNKDAGPSRISKTTATTIDHVITSDNSYIKTSTVQCNYSDHDFILSIDEAKIDNNAHNRTT